MTAPLRVVMADDHAPTRLAVGAALERNGVLVVASVPSGDEAVAAARQFRPDVCLLDVHMPGNGILAAADITRELPDVSVVMLTASADDEDLFAALRAGASGYLVKSMDPDRIAPALRSIMAGESVLPRWLVQKVAEEFRSRPRRRIPLPNRERAAQLTEREAEVLTLMAEGLSTEEIAQQLFLAAVTIRTHISAILRKLRVPDRAAAVRLSRGTG